MTKPLLTGADFAGPLQVNGSAGTAGQVLTSAGTGSVPTWANAAGGYSAVIATMTATQAITAATLTNITQLTIAMVANATYRCEAFITFQSNVASVGATFGYTSPTGCRPMIITTIPVTSVAGNSTSGPVVGLSPSAANITAFSSIGTAVSPANSNHTANLNGIIVNGSTAGNFQLQFASESGSGTITLQVGSVLVLTRIA